MATPISSRDTFLDCLKGLAIGTVVLGHTFQGATPDFDHYLPFRLIYAFHMPMFMFIAGMTASLSFSRRLRDTANYPSYLADIRFKALRLVLPFITWAVIQYFWIKPAEYNPATWLLHILHYPDNGLWFLWILFLCSCVLALICAGIEYAYRLIATARSDGGENSAVLYLLLMLVWPVASAMLHALPSDPGLALTKSYFLYFFAGFAFHIIRPAGLPPAVRWIPYVIFIALVPFWYRTEISPVASLFSNPGAANNQYVRIVAFTGTLAFVDFTRLFVRWAPALLARTVAFVGRRSLDIYAIHFYALGYLPRVIAPIVISLAVSFVLRTNPVTSWLFLGQKPMKMWRMTGYRLFPKHAGTTHNAVAVSENNGP
jgi:fucose 4-O-acetylase-like acetyltransferase